MLDIINALPSEPPENKSEIEVRQEERAKIPEPPSETPVKNEINFHELFEGAGYHNVFYRHFLPRILALVPTERRDEVAQLSRVIGNSQKVKNVPEFKQKLVIILGQGDIYRQIEGMLNDFLDANVARSSKKSSPERDGSSDLAQRRVSKAFERSKHHEGADSREPATSPERQLSPLDRAVLRYKDFLATENPELNWDGKYGIRRRKSIHWCIELILYSKIRDV